MVEMDEIHIGPPMLVKDDDLDEMVAHSGVPIRIFIARRGNRRKAKEDKGTLRPGLFFANDVKIRRIPPGPGLGRVGRARMLSRIC